MKNLAIETKEGHTTISAGGIIERLTSHLKPWPNNPRTHSEKQLTKLKASIQKFGFTAPVLTDESGVILSGHGRVLAAISLGLPAIPTRVITGLSEAQKRAYVIADNKIAILSGWDDVLLKSEMEILIQQDFDI
jgi:ParB-like chromosome segregation protein Spo0J